MTEPRPTNDLDYEQGILLGQEVWEVAVEPDHRSYNFVEPLTKVMLTIGYRAALLKPPIVDLDRFHRGALAGLAAAAAQRSQPIEAHAKQALCDPTSPRGMCPYCEAYHGYVATILGERQRWNAQLDNSANVFAITPGMSQKIHTLTCPSIRTIIKLAEQEMAEATPQQALEDLLDARWPTALDRTAAVKLNRHRCRICAPDIPAKVTRQPAAKGARGQFQTESTTDITNPMEASHD
ncbi:hypothetical protein KIH74_35505 [Kineosporia sp. J2-2]|uniref:YwqJ-like deaminase n=1 Tax=Kineosporia corallincola TaxID=2835133 RepID=A0ABS5TU51_9ACTN|nr:hypothetical protein [Kineosporia corallincola]MBT0774305.1 hypothetical protein [Kineosporia corallincola]